MRYTEIIEKFNRNVELLQELDLDYAGKIKGDLYIKRKTQLINKQDALKKQALSLGTVGTICHVSGKRSRASRKNPQVQIQENFNLYFVNITETEASALTKLHVKNIVHHKITFYRPGVIITSS